MFFFYLTAVKSSSIGSGKDKRRPLSAHLFQPRPSAKPPPAFDTSKTKRQLDLIEKDLKLTTKTLQDRLGIAKQGFVWIKERLPPCFVSLRKQLTFRDAWPQLVYSRNDIWATGAEISSWWRFTTHIWVVLLIGWSKFFSRHDQSEADLGGNTSSEWNFFALSFRSTSFRGIFWIFFFLISELKTLKPPWLM